MACRGRKEVSGGEKEFLLLKVYFFQEVLEWVLSNIKLPSQETKRERERERESARARD